MRAGVHTHAVIWHGTRGRARACSTRPLQTPGPALHTCASHTFGSMRSVIMFLSWERLKAKKSCRVSGILDSVPLGKGIVLPAPNVLA